MMLGTATCHDAMMKDEAHFSTFPAPWYSKICRFRPGPERPRREHRFVIFLACFWHFHTYIILYKLCRFCHEDDVDAVVSCIFTVQHVDFRSSPWGQHRCNFYCNFLQFRAGVKGLCVKHVCVCERFSVKKLLCVKESLCRNCSVQSLVCVKGPVCRRASGCKKMFRAKAALCKGSLV